MNAPDVIIERESRTPAGYLSTHDAQLVGAKLMRGGFALLPSDTCYSLAALAVRRDTFTNVNLILDRGGEPISLAFANYLEVRRYVALELLSQSILETFTPGPVTLVCRAHAPHEPVAKPIPEEFLTDVVGSSDRTIGVRIPDSLVERDVAAITGFPVTSTAVRDSRGQAVRDFEQALGIVQSGMSRLPGGRGGWVAVEGGDFVASHSSVVRVENGRVREIREGAIPLSAFEALAAKLPIAAMDDWA